MDFTHLLSQKDYVDCTIRCLKYQQHDGECYVSENLSFKKRVGIEDIQIYYKENERQ